MTNYVPLEKVCDFLDSLRKPVTSTDRIKGQYPYYGANGVQDYVKDYIFDDELVLLAEDGGHFDDPLRGVAYRVSGKCWVNNHAHVLKPKDNIDVDYLGYVLKQYDVRPYITGAIIKKLNQQAARKMLIPLPPLDIQKQIVVSLNQTDSLRSKRKQVIDLLDEYIKSVFIEMFGDPVSNPNGWKTLKGSDYAQLLTVGVVIKPASYYKKSGVLALRSLNIRANAINLSDVVYFSPEDNNGKLSKSKLSYGDVVIVRTGSTGTAAVIPEELEGVNCIDMIIVRPRRDVINPYYLCFLLNSDRGVHLISMKEVGGIQKHFNIGALKQLSIPIPPIEMQNQFADLLQKSEELKQKMLEQSRELDNQFQALMQKSFSIN